MKVIIAGKFFTITPSILLRLRISPIVVHFGQSRSGGSWASDDAVDAVDDHSIVDLCYDTDQANSVVVVCVGQVTRLQHRNYVHERP